MLSQNFEVVINAAANKVWFALWNKPHYEKWTSVFCEGSYAESDWKEGSSIRFLSPAGDGMYSIIEENKPFEKMFFKHIGEIKSFKEQPITEATEEWTNAVEQYRLTDNNGITTLIVTMDIVEKHLQYFSDTFPKGLALVKQMAENMTITVETFIEAPIEKVWECWTAPTHITNWCHASDDWYAPKASNDLRVGGIFSTTMSSTDNKIQFEFGGTYTNIINKKQIDYVLGDGRKVFVSFDDKGIGVQVKETFDPETLNPLEMQQAGWQAILDNFKKYVLSI